MNTKEKFQQVHNKYKNLFPVPVVKIAVDLGIKVFATSSLEDKFSGAIAKEGDSFVIYVNNRHPETRQLFTIAHELGHYVNDQDYFAEHNQIIDSYRQLNRAEVAADPKLRNRDILANKFAADLLMPDEEFKKEFYKSQNIEEVAKYFNVSVSAASIRAKELLGYTEF